MQTVSSTMALLPSGSSMIRVKHTLPSRAASISPSSVSARLTSSSLSAHFRAMVTTASMRSSRPSTFDMYASDAGPGSMSRPHSGMWIVPDVDRMTRVHMWSAVLTFIVWRMGSFWPRISVSAYLNPQAQTVLISITSPK
ncbi:MAG: hypothetical protein A4E28_02542 [Methanocella sp. PtaU1.Bin125]|nr:MAG: hypothetical protein A4E28_02542 [Methanocella sp. PtaU1.Bin125]